MKEKINLLILFLVMQICTNAQSVKDYGINIRCVIDTINHKVNLSWEADTNTYNFFVYRKNTSDSIFGDYIAKLPKTQLSFTDTIIENREIEYKIEKDAVKYYAYGYISVGIKINTESNKGTLLLLIDSTIALPLKDEIEQYKRDIIADGWQVISYLVPRAEKFDREKVQITKNLIKQLYSLNNDIKTLVLLGRVAVPYSGDFAMDGHEDHYGAWPTDPFYADVDGKWTDTLTNRYKVDDLRIENLPNDGKFDQLMYPSDLELETGRIDLYDLLYFQQDEIELIKNYLKKISKFKNAEIELSRRGAIIDNFGPNYKEGFAASGWTNFYSIVGADSVNYLSDRYILQEKDYLWYYGCGPGNYLAAHEALYSEELASMPFNAGFVMVFGSYHGDWDSQNNVMRSVLGANPYGFTCVWSGRPHWFFHQMAFGKHIGFSARLTQNVYPEVYTAVSPFARRTNHIALMGDPTLRLHYFEKPSNVKTYLNADGIRVTWDYPENKNVTFTVYRSNKISGVFEKISTSDFYEKNFVDRSPNLGNNIYMIRAVRLENVPSGSYFNYSLGSFSETIAYPSEFNTQIVIAPNPSNGQIKIALPATKKLKSISLYDLEGNNINSFKIDPNPNKDFIELNLKSQSKESIAQGLYYIEFILENGQTEYHKIIIQK